MTDVLVRPYPGLILAGVPRSGARIPAAQADDWEAHGLVVRVPEPTTPPAATPKPAAISRRSKR